jgi:hypothetical protein
MLQTHRSKTHIRCQQVVIDGIIHIKEADLSYVCFFLFVEFTELRIIFSLWKTILMISVNKVLY